MTPTIGREAERAQLAELVSGLGAPAALGHTLLLVGEPGSGKSTLLQEAADLASAAGAAVLRARGTPTEHEIPYATLHQLLHPLLGHVPQLPDRQRVAVESAFGLTDDDPNPDQPLLAVAVLTLLSDASGSGGLLVVVDDLQWADPASARVVELVAGRVAAERMVLLAASRPEATLPDLPRLHLEPLTPAAAEALLGAVADVPPGPARRRLLRLAEGNPLAIVELSKVALPDAPGDAGLPLTDRLQHAFSARTDTLPERTRWLLLLAAAAGEEDLAILLEHTATDGAGDGLSDWVPAERAGLVQLGPRAVRFRHPLVGSALYAAAPLAERQAAHLELARLLAEVPYRRAWHLAAAAPGRDEQAAAALEESARLAQLRGGWAAAARWQERAAALSPREEDAARRMLQAAWAALLAGHAPRVVELAEEVEALTPLSTEQHAQAAFLRGWALSQSLDHVGAVTLLTSAVEEAVRAGADEVALTALAPAGVAAYFAGDDAVLGRVRDAVDHVGPSNAAQVVWARAVTDPVRGTAETVAHLTGRLAAAGGPGGLDIVDRNVLSGAAWVVDETETAIELMRAFLGAFDQPATAGTHALVGNTLGSALFEAGRWDEAWEVLEWARRMAVETGMDVVHRSASATCAQLAALRGQVATARDLAARATAGLDPAASRSVGVRARWSLGLAAAVDGNWEEAYSTLRGLVLDGAPAHPHLALYALPDLVTAAVRTGRDQEAREVAALLADRTVGGSARLRILTAHATALTSPNDAEHHFTTALEEPLGERWPVERARVAVDYGAWLRRRRRVRDARGQLRAALETFSRVGARPLADHTRHELRAAGVRSPSSPSTARDDALAQLTPQQRQIALLAAQGLTNREIGERLFLSPRTVGFHLYRVFPLLGITSRMQLRDVLDEHGPVI